MKAITISKNIFITQPLLMAWLRIVIVVSKLKQLFPSMADKDESCVLSGMHLNISPALCLSVWHKHRSLT